MADTRTPIPAGLDARTPTPGRALRVRHCATRHGEPLADVYGLPGDGAELRPAELRALAAALLLAAADCEALPISNGRRMIERRYPADDDAGARPAADPLRSVRDAPRVAAPPADACPAVGTELRIAVSDLWFLLDQIMVISDAIPLFQEHMSDADLDGRVSAVARTIACLAELAKKRHAAIERMANAL
jgi:hypothetical protein